MTKKQIEEEMKCNKDFAWAVSQLLLGKTVRRDEWSGRPYTFTGIQFIGEYLQILKPKLPKEFNVLKNDNHCYSTIAKINISGSTNVGWIPDMEDFLAKDWGPGYPDYKELEKKLFED